jgi:hypothetical protein
MAFMAFDALLDAGRTSRNLEIATLAQFARDVMRDVLRPAFCGRTSISRSTDKSLPGTVSVRPAPQGELTSPNRVLPVG